MHTLFSFLLFVPTVSAHQPRIVNEVYATETVPISVEKPEISKAYYGDLKGEPEYYRIYSKEPFRLYVGILVPAIEGAEPDISAHILDGGAQGNVLYELVAEDAQWEEFYEEYGGDTYLYGPELSSGEDTYHPRGIEVEGGTYMVKVFSPDNRGKYVLAVGDTESFTPGEMVKAIPAMAKVKIYFGKSPLSALGLSTVWMFIAKLVVPVLLLVAGVWWWKRHEAEKSYKQ